MHRSWPPPVFYQMSNFTIWAFLMWASVCGLFERMAGELFGNEHRAITGYMEPSPGHKPQRRVLQS